MTLRFCILSNISQSLQKGDDYQNWDVINTSTNSTYSTFTLVAQNDTYESVVEVSSLELLIYQLKEGIDPYTATVVNTLTGVEDWVHDPVNDQIVYTEKKQLNFQYMYKYMGENYYLDQLGQAANKYYEGIGVNNPQCAGEENGSISCTALGGIVAKATKIINPAYDPDAKGEEKYLPLPTVAQQVISNAESGDSTAQQLINGLSARIDMGSLLDQLNLNKVKK